MRRVSNSTFLGFDFLRIMFAKEHRGEAAPVRVARNNEWLAGLLGSSRTGVALKERHFIQVSQENQLTALSAAKVMCALEPTSHFSQPKSAVRAVRAPLCSQSPVVSFGARGKVKERIAVADLSGPRDRLVIKFAWDM